MIAPEYFNNHVAIEGEIIVKSVPNDAGFVLVWNPSTKKISRRTHAEIITDLQLITETSWNNITGKKWFITDGGNDNDNNTLRISGRNSYDAGITFIKEGVDVGQLLYNGYSFSTKTANGIGYIPIKSSGFIKSDSDGNHVLLGDGGHKLISDFSLTNHTHRSLYASATGNVNIDTLMEDYTMRFDTIVFPSSGNGFPNMANNANGVLSISSHPGYGVQFGFNTFGEFWIRNQQNSSWNTWDKVITQSTIDNFFSKDRIQSKQILTVATTLDAELPDGGFISSYNTGSWAGSDRPIGASYGGYIKFSRGSGDNNNLDFYYNNGHNGTSPRLWYRTKEGINGARDWMEIYHTGNINQQLGFYHKIDSTGALDNASDTHTNQTWFEYNYAGTGQRGSVANFSGLSGGYSTELFASYDNPNKIAIRSRQGDNNTWNEPNWLWHDKNFNPASKVNKSGDTMTGVLDLKSGLILSDSNSPQIWSIYQTTTGINFYVTGGNTQGDVIKFTQEGYIQASGFIKSGSSNAHVLLGDGNDKSINDFITNDSWNNITGKKWFITDNGNDWDNNTLRIHGKNGYNAGITFIRDGIDVGQIIFDGYNFKTTNSNGDGYKPIISSHFIKNGSSNAHVLLGDGSDKPISDFITAGDASTRALGFTGADINLAPYIYTNTGEFRYLATQNWVNENFASSAQLGDYLPKSYDSTAAIATSFLRGNSTAGRFKIRLPYQAGGIKMLAFTIRMYGSYTHTDIACSGYLYNAINQWHLPSAKMIVAHGSDPTIVVDVIFGRDTDGIAYVSIPKRAYDGIAILDVVGGYNPGVYGTGWTITEDDTTPNIATTINVEGLNRLSQLVDDVGYATTSQLLSKVNKSGDTMTGPLSIKSDGAIGIWKGYDNNTNYLIWRNYGDTKDIAYIGADGNSASSGGAGDGFAIVAPAGKLQIKALEGVYINDGLAWTSQNFNPDSFLKNNEDNTLKTITASNYNDVVDGSGKIWIGNFYDVDTSITGFENNIGTILNINGLLSHDKTQFIFNGSNGNIQYRTSWYPNTAWSTPRTLWDSNNFNPANYVTLGTPQAIPSRKAFSGSTGNVYNESAIETRGNGNTIFPSISFHQPGSYAGTISLRNSEFAFRNTDDSGFYYLKSSGFIKDGSSNAHVLLGNGDHLPISSFASGKYISYQDNRQINPSEMEPTKFGYGFTSWNNDENAGDTWADYLHFGGYPDASGGNQNLIVFNKSVAGIRQYQGLFQDADPYTNFVDYWHTGNFSQSYVDEWIYKANEGIATVPMLNNKVSKSGDENIDGVKLFMGAYTQWLLNGDSSNAKGFIQSFPTQLGIGTLNDKALVLYNNGNTKVAINNNNVTFVDLVNAPSYQTTGGGSIDNQGNLKIQQVLVGGNATGIWWNNKDNSGNRIAGIGALTTNGNLDYLYMGWGAAPWQSSTSFAVSDSIIQYKGNNIWHAGNFNPDIKANGQENAAAIGFSSGVYPTNDGVEYPYIFHKDSGVNTPYVALATQQYVQSNYIPNTHVANSITLTNILQWNNIYNYGIRVNQQFTANTGNEIAIVDDYNGGESGLYDKSYDKMIAGKDGGEYYKYGSNYNNYNGLNFHLGANLFGVGKEITNDEDKVQVAGNISVDATGIFDNRIDLILNPLYDISGDVRRSRNAHIYIVTRNTVRLPDKPILGQRIEIFNDSDGDIEVTHGNVGVMFHIPGFCKVTGVAANKGFKFDAEPIRTKQYDI